MIHDECGMQKRFVTICCPLEVAGLEIINGGQNHRDLGDGNPPVASKGGALMGVWGQSPRS